MGGTIDAEAFPNNQWPNYSTPSPRRLTMTVLRNIAEARGEKVEFECIPVCNKDSKDYTDFDRDTLHKTIQEKGASYPRIIVTSGTDKLIDTAKNLKSQMGTTPICPIIFTGAMRPLANKDSDGRENLELAAFGKPDAAPDIYVAMHGHFVLPGQIYKDFDKRKFVLR